MKFCLFVSYVLSVYLCEMGCPSEVIDFMLSLPIDASYVFGPQNLNLQKYCTIDAMQCIRSHTWIQIRMVSAANATFEAESGDSNLCWHIKILMSLTEEIAHHKIEHLVRNSCK